MQMVPFVLFAPGLALLALPRKADPIASPLQIQIHEEFHAEGPEATFWAAHSQSDFERRETENGQVAFDFELTRLDVLIGDIDKDIGLQVTDDPDVENGVRALTISQDPATQAVGLEGAQAIADFANHLVGNLDDRPRGTTWSEEVELFNGDVIPGLSPLNVRARFRTEPYKFGTLECTILQYASERVRYEANGSQVWMEYTGLGVIGRDKKLVYQMAFRQNGVVVTRGERTEVNHLYLVSLLNQGDQQVVPWNFGRLKQLYNEFDFLPKPDGTPLPDVLDPKPRPPWANSVWMSGRMASLGLSLVSEQSSNPLPVAAMGSTLLTNEVVGFAANYYYDVKAREKDEFREVMPSDGDFPSPLDVVYSPEARAKVPAIAPTQLLGPEVQGTVWIGDDFAPLGLLALPHPAGSVEPVAPNPPKATEMLNYASAENVTSSLVVLGAPAPAAAPLAAILAGGTSAGVVAGGAAGLGGGGGGGSSTVQLDIVESNNQNSIGGLPCYEGFVNLTVSGLGPGVAVSIMATGNPEQGGNWSASASGTTDLGGGLKLQLKFPEHCSCMLNPSISVSVGGSPATMDVTLNQASLGTHQSPFTTNNCL